MSYVKTCCDAVPQGKVYFRQARSLASGNLVDEWFEASRIPAGPADFKLYSYQSNQCLFVRFTDAKSDAPGTVGKKWDAINTAQEETLVCGTSGSIDNVYLPFQSDDGSGGTYRDLAFSFTGPVAASGMEGTTVTATAVGTVTFNYICDRAGATCHHQLQVFRVRSGVPSAVSGVFSDTRDGGGGSVAFSVQTGDVLRVQLTASSGGCAARYHDDAGVSVSGDTCPDDPPTPPGPTPPTDDSPVIYLSDTTVGVPGTTVECANPVNLADPGHWGSDNAGHYPSSIDKQVDGTYRIRLASTVSGPWSQDYVGATLGSVFTKDGVVVGEVNPDDYTPPETITLSTTPF